MHYSDPQSDKVLTVFGEKSPGLFYNYSDRLIGKEWDDAQDSADENGFTRGTAAWFEWALKHFHGAKKLDLRHMLLGVNRSNGYHYHVYGYTYET